MNARQTSDLDLAARLADAARAPALKHFRTQTAVTDKARASDGAAFDPVTAADQEAEAAIRAILAQARPDDGVIGEEGGVREGRSGRIWVIDPIDGTRAFIAGLPTWCVLIALIEDGRPALSVIDQPYTDERFLGIDAAGARNAWIERGGERRPLRVSGRTRLEESILSTTDPNLFPAEERVRFEALRARARLTRYGLDAYAYAMTALGGVDLVVESGLKLWDRAALAPVVRGAGGLFTGWKGEDDPASGAVVAAAGEALHAEALRVLGSAV